MPKGRYSELECFVLGVIWQLGPCSPYDIRRHLAASPSTQWSGSAGAIYPLVRKLEQRRLLRAKDRSTGKRARRVYVITPAGQRILHAWIGPPLAPEAITVAYDPLRTRARFLAAIPPAQRTAWVRAAEAALSEVGERVRNWQTNYGGDDPFLSLITRNGELDVASRREWLRTLAEAVGIDSPSASGGPGAGAAAAAGSKTGRGSRRSSPGRGG